MPYFMDAMGYGAWVRACLPMLNRFGQSIPPLLLANWVGKRPRKKFIQSGCCLVMGICFLLFATGWSLATTPALAGTPETVLAGNRTASGSSSGTTWMPLFFLALYGTFFCAVGILQLATGTLTGKLVAVLRRGQLMLVSLGLGVAFAVAAALLVLRGWLSPTPQFVWIFGTSGSLFLLCSIVALLLREPDSPVNDESISQLNPVGWARQTLGLFARDRQLLLLAIIAGLFGMSITLFPHYQALAFQRLELGSGNLLWWLIAQNIGVGIFGIPAGRLADVCGNRLVLRIALVLVAGAPLLALGLTQDWIATGLGQQLYVVVFVIVGLTPVLMRVIHNFVLELAEPEAQPIYLGLISVCMAGPAIMTSTLLGTSIDTWGFEPAFGIVVGCLLAAWALTLAIGEPRQARRDASSDFSQNIG